MRQGPAPWPPQSKKEKPFSFEQGKQFLRDEIKKDKLLTQAKTAYEEARLAATAANTKSRLTPFKTNPFLAEVQRLEDLQGVIRGLLRGEKVPNYRYFRDGEKQEKGFITKAGTIAKDAVFGKEHFPKKEMVKEDYERLIQDIKKFATFSEDLSSPANTFLDDYPDFGKHRPRASEKREQLEYYRKLYPKVTLKEVSETVPASAGAIVTQGAEEAVPVTSEPKTKGKVEKVKKRKKPAPKKEKPPEREPSEDELYRDPNSYVHDESFMEALEQPILPGLAEEELFKVIQEKYVYEREVSTQDMKRALYDYMLSRYQKMPTHKEKQHIYENAQEALMAIRQKRAFVPNEVVEQIRARKRETPKQREERIKQEEKDIKKERKNIEKARKDERAKVFRSATGTALVVLLEIIGIYKLLNPEPETLPAPPLAYGETSDTTEENAPRIRLTDPDQKFPEGYVPDDSAPPPIEITPDDFGPLREGHNEDPGYLRARNDALQAYQDRIRGQNTQARETHQDTTGGGVGGAEDAPPPEQ